MKKIFVIFLSLIMPAVSYAATCAAGKYLSGSSCVTCDIGYYCPGNDRREYCYDIDGIGMAYMGAPYYSNTTGATECKRCPTASYSPDYYWFWWTEDNSLRPIHMYAESCRAAWSFSISHGYIGFSCAYGTDANYTGIGSKQKCLVDSLTCDAGYALNTSRSYVYAPGGGVWFSGYQYASSLCEEAGYGNYSPSGTYVATSCGTGKTTTTTTASSSSQCVCDAGYGGSSCTACQAGYYKSSTGSGSCSACRAGTYASGTGNSSCTSCPAGSYSSGTGNTSCTECTNYKYASGTGNTSCVLPPAGYNSRGCSGSSYSGTGCTDYEQCGTGYYCPGDGTYSSCSSYRSNTTTTTSTATSASECVCEAGYRLSGSSCAKCPTGTYKTSASNATSCTSCGTGKTTSSTGATSSSSCICDAGYTGSSCTACAKGTYKSGTGSAACTSCGTGKTTSSTGSTSSSDCICDAGYGGSSCTVCAKGTYKSGTGSAACTKCGENMTTASTGSTSADACVCIDGYEMVDGKCVEPSRQTACSAGAQVFHAGGLSFPMWDECDGVALWFGLPAGKCCVNLQSGSAVGAVNVQYNGATYHTTD